MFIILWIFIAILFLHLYDIDKHSFVYTLNWKDFKLFDIIILIIIFPIDVLVFITWIVELIVNNSRS